VSEIASSSFTNAHIFINKALIVLTGRLPGDCHPLLARGSGTSHTRRYRSSNSALGLHDEEFAELMAETVHRTLESDRPVSSGEAQTISRTFTQYLNRAMEIERERFQQALE